MNNKFDQVGGSNLVTKLIAFSTLSSRLIVDILAPMSSTRRDEAIGMQNLNRLTQECRGGSN
jgi:hypothetical protein